MSNETLFAFLDDLCVGCQVERVTHVHDEDDREWCVHYHHDNTKSSNRGDMLSSACAELQSFAQHSNPRAQMWRIDRTLPTSEQRLTIFVQSQLEAQRVEHEVLHDIPADPDLHAARLLPLHYTAASVNFSSRTARPESMTEVPRRRDLEMTPLLDRGFFPLFSNLSGNDVAPTRSWRTGTSERYDSPLTGIAGRQRVGIVKQRHTAVAREIVRVPTMNSMTPSIQTVVQTEESLREGRFERSSREELVEVYKWVTSSYHAWQHTPARSLETSLIQHTGWSLLDESTRS